MLPLSFYLRSPSMGHFSRSGFVDGWRELGADSLESMKEALPPLLEDLRGDRPVKGKLAGEGKGGLFARVYEWCYAYARDEGQKSLCEWPQDKEGWWSQLLLHVLTRAPQLWRQHWPSGAC